MSDSDDTDVLLFIPPDFFTVADSQPTTAELFSRELLNKDNNEIQMSSQFLLPNGDNQTDLDSINARITNLERNFSAPSDISSISNCTTKSNLVNFTGKDYELESESKKFHSLSNYSHSTPKCCMDKQKKEENETCILKEIDIYLGTKNDLWTSDISRSTFSGSKCCAYNFPNNSQIFNNNQEDSSVPHNTSTKTNNSKLISLQDLWGSNGEEGVHSIQEERLRRQHLERIIKALQEKLLEYQQKISVAIEIDKVKDNVIKELKTDNISIKEQKAQLDEQINILESQQNEWQNNTCRENKELKIRIENLEKELVQALELATKSQHKNEALEDKVEELSKAYSEAETIYKRRIEELENKITNFQQSIRVDTGNVSKIKEQLVKLQNDGELVRVQKAHLEKQSELLQGEIDLLKQQKHTIFEKYKEEKERIATLEKQNKSFKETVSELYEKEKKLLKELELQRISLKSHYQKQLEEVVAEKLKEFQTQLDRVEESLKSGAKDRECLIAERAIKQIELINEKNEQEIKLLTEKHQEEIELYRIQLLNSTKQIEELEEKLHLYKSRRADIAERLHNVMETQWRKALEILTVPNANTTESFQSINPQNADQNKLDGINRKKNNQQVENESFDTPRSSRCKRYERSNSRERLQAYIELLLRKSPKDFENLEEILRMKESADTVKCDKNCQKKESFFKPPWK